jgi:hypothetical protein
MREIPAFAMLMPGLGREVDPGYLNIKTQPLWQDKSQAFAFTGSLHNISVCERRNIDNTIIGSKGGPSKG